MEGTLSDFTGPCADLRHVMRSHGALRVLPAPHGAPKHRFYVPYILVAQCADNTNTGSVGGAGADPQT